MKRPHRPTLPLLWFALAVVVALAWSVAPVGAQAPTATVPADSGTPASPAATGDASGVTFLSPLGTPAVPVVTVSADIFSSPLSTPAPSGTVTFVSPLATPTRAPTATATVTATPTASPTPADTATPSPTPQLVPPPPPPPPGDIRTGEIVGAVAIIAGIVYLLVRALRRSLQ